MVCREDEPTSLHLLRGHTCKERDGRATEPSAPSPSPVASSNSDYRNQNCSDPFSLSHTKS